MGITLLQGNVQFPVTLPTCEAHKVNLTEFDALLVEVMDSGNIESALNRLGHFFKIHCSYQTVDIIVPWNFPVGEMSAAGKEWDIDSFSVEPYTTSLVHHPLDLTTCVDYKYISGLSTTLSLTGSSCLSVVTIALTSIFSDYHARINSNPVNDNIRSIMENNRQGMLRLLRNTPVKSSLDAVCRSMLVDYVERASHLSSFEFELDATLLRKMLLVEGLAELKLKRLLTG